jgi:hypothetical protein
MSALVTAPGLHWVWDAYTVGPDHGELNWWFDQNDSLSRIAYRWLDVSGNPQALLIMEREATP